MLVHTNKTQHKQVRATGRPPFRSLSVPEDHKFSLEIAADSNEAARMDALNSERLGIHAFLVLPHRQLDSRSKSWVNKIRWRLCVIERHVTEATSESCGGFVLAVAWHIRTRGIAAEDTSTQCVHAAVSRCLKLWNSMFGFIDNDIIETVSSEELLLLPIEIGLAHVMKFCAREIV